MCRGGVSTAIAVRQAQIRQSRDALMRCSPMHARSGSDASRYTHLSACVTEDEDGFTVQVRLYHEAKPEDGAWGEEIADSFETASALLDALATRFSIPQACIKIRIRMHDLTNGTKH